MLAVYAVHLACHTPHMSYISNVTYLTSHACPPCTSTTSQSKRGGASSIAVACSPYTFTEHTSKQGGQHPFVPPSQQHPRSGRIPHQASASGNTSNDVASMQRPWHYKRRSRIHHQVSRTTEAAQGDGTLIGKRGLYRERQLQKVELSTRINLPHLHICI